MVGRNDPCPCGSGKKYKKCCLQRDEEARRIAAAHAASEAARPPRTAVLHASSMTHAQGLWDAEEEQALAKEAETFEATGLVADALDERWEEFHATEDYEGRIALFLRTLDDGLMDPENAFEMLNIIYEDTAARDERGRFDALVAQLRERLPEVYAHDAHFYVEWLISNALASGRLDSLPALADELADTAGEQLDTVNRVLDQLAYHGQLSVLARVMRRAWPLVREADQYLEWAVREFVERGVTIAILDHLERIGVPDAADLEALAVEFDIAAVQSGALAQFLAHVTGQVHRHWTLADFGPAAPRQRKDGPNSQAEDAGLNLYHLIVEFMGYLRRAEGVSYARGELACSEIYHYLLRRHTGKLQDDDWRQAGRGRTKARPAALVHPLCPDRDTLDRYLAGLLSIFNSRPHRAAALFEALPAWLQFLVSCQLIDADQRDSTLRELADLADDLWKVVGSSCSDPAVRLAAESWRRMAGLE